MGLGKTIQTIVFLYSLYKEVGLCVFSVQQSLADVLILSCHIITPGRRYCYPSCLLVCECIS